MVVTSPQDHHLFIRTRYQVEIDLEKPLETQVEESEVQGCNHDIRRQRLQAVAALREVAGERRHRGRPMFAQAMIQCDCCPTDFLCEARRKEDELFAELTVFAWRDLGGRGDHLAALWKMQVEPYYGSTSFARASYQFRNQSLKELYESARQMRGA